MTDTEKTRWLAEKVMDWRTVQTDALLEDSANGLVFSNGNANIYDWSPLDYISDAFECQKKWIYGVDPDAAKFIRRASNFTSPYGHSCTLLDEDNDKYLCVNTKPERAICEALLRATGYEEEA